MKDSKFELRLPSEVKREFFAFCQQRGLNPSEVARNLITQALRQVRNNEFPQLKNQGLQNQVVEEDPLAEV